MPNEEKERMQRVRETQGEVGEITKESQGQDGIEVSGDAAIIADAIAGGLGEIAEGMRMIAKALAGDEGEPMEEERYLDGSRK